MRAYALTCEALAALSSTQGKVQCAAAYLSGRPREELEVAARFLAGTVLPPGSQAPRVGDATIVEIVAERCGIPAAQLRRRATSRGDLGEAVAAVLADGPPSRGAALALSEVAETLATLGRQAATRRSRLLDGLFARTDGLEAKYLAKLLVGSLRTGMQAGRVEEAIALAFQEDAEAIRRAHMLLGDIGEVAVRAADHALDGVRLRAFRPVRCMLAHPVDSADELFRTLSPPMLAEDKFDGVRAQLHVADGKVRLFSRSLEDCTHLFPELVDAPPALSGTWILDGEVVGWKEAVLPFNELQQRLGRRQVPLTLLLDVPVVFFAFDVLEADGDDVLDLPLRRRRELLARLPDEGAVRAAASRTVEDIGQAEEFFRAALDRGNEGAVFKDLDSPYRPGVRGRAWVKLKQPLATLDVVVTAAEYGHGKRAGWLSDLTFAVRGSDELLDVGKAYSGLTDAEIVELTEHFKRTTTRRHGARHEVEPTIVLEVAFGGVQRSDRHSSGFALRFPRIVRRRPDLDPGDIDTLERIEEIWSKTA